MSWGLAIDFGTSFTAGAVHDRGTVELVEVEDSARFPSAVLLADDGSLLTGRAAINQARRFPERYERSPKRLVGQPAALLGGQAAEVVDMVGAVLRRVGEAAVTRQGSTAPGWVRLTHPAGWGGERQEVLREAARRAGLGEVELLTEPEAAAWFFVEDRRGEEPVVGPGGCVAVYDLGGGTFDTAILRRSETGFSLAGPPGGLDWFGGEDFDQRLYDWVLGRLYELDQATWRSLKEPSGPQARRMRFQLREDVRQAKEALSSTPVVSVPVGTEDDRVIDVSVTREDFEGLIRDDLKRTVAVLEKTARDANVGSEGIVAVYLTGGSSRVPLAGALVAQAHPRVYTRPDPKTLVSRGAIAARFPPAAAAAAPAVAPEPPSAAAPAPQQTPTQIAPESPLAAAPARPKRSLPAAGVRPSPVVLGAAVLGVLILAGVIVAVLGGSGQPRLEVTGKDYVTGARNAATVSGTVDPEDAAVTVGGKKAKVREGRWRATARPDARGTLRVSAVSGDGEPVEETVTVPGPRLGGAFAVVQRDVFANSVIIGGPVDRARASWSFDPRCRGPRCTGSVLVFPAPGGVTRVKLERQGKVFSGSRSYTLPLSGVCLGQPRASRWNTRIRLTVTDWRRAGGARVATRFTGVARHRSRFSDALPCKGARLVTRLTGRRS